MKTERHVALAIVLLAVAASTFAAPVIVTFVDGSAQVQSGLTWKKLDFDDKFDSPRSVKLAAGAVLEIKAQNGSVVTIAAPGTYVVDSLFKPRSEQGAMATSSGARALAALRTASPEDAGALRGSYAPALATLSARYGATADAKVLLQKAIAAGWFDDPAALADAKSLLAGL